MERLRHLQLKVEMSVMFTNDRKRNYRLAILKWLALDNSLQPVDVDILIRYEFLSEKFKVSYSYLTAYAGGDIGMKPRMLKRMGEWCLQNQDYQLKNVYNSGERSSYAFAARHVEEMTKTNLTLLT
jgi:hypothetical protein